MGQMVYPVTSVFLRSFSIYKLSNFFLMQVQVVGSIGGLPPSDPSINASTVFAASFWLTQGITSRGRIGINGSLTALSLVDPWFQDINDKTAMIAAIEDVFANLTTNG
jgi:cellobiose dehydrogenase (acceptor)